MPLSIGQPQTTSFAKRAFHVFKAWMKQPTQVATICPSSPFLMENIADRDCVRNASSVVELGPGAGGTTLALLAQMRPDGRLLAIEKTDAFREALDDIADPRFTPHIGDATDLITLLEQHQFGRPDVIVSGVPFSAIPPAVAKNLVQAIHQVLKPGGEFIAYQVRSDVERFARPLFGPAETEKIAINIPPLTVFTWRKIQSPSMTRDIA
ncbi:Methyltransferase type 12 domain protein [Rhodopirellula maiorica SM1]|uniref:Methyltransferase type 12 domain protein n=1 Tax=Rhodopirellula maiorica SM1 TaxID=1265738 RepID=M5R7I0_9BACT|nr:methyltransferase domain-containing protein [Rhodopirellula maiorica]EMI15330.1 Methyltransferase type 12 domain protein [Rhodopirellula maiorica SM1]